MGSPEPIDADIVVVGAGAAGLYAALVAADRGARVAVVSATPLAQTASYWAQGDWRPPWPWTTRRRSTLPTPSSPEEGSRGVRRPKS